jgi:hypothetical protein
MEFWILGKPTTMKKSLLFFVAALFVLSFLGFAKDDGCPDLRAELIFNHQLHVEDVGAQCTDCHKAVNNSTSPLDPLLPGMDVCGDCHDVKDAASCGDCHKNPQNVHPIPYVVPNYDFFSHQKHLNSGLDCRTCHANIYKSTQVTKKTKALPKMADCMNCHRKEGQTENCGACHTGLHPRSDDFDLMSRRTTHGPDVAMNPDRYQRYFEPADCEDCHQGLNLAGEVHPQGWLFVHAAEAASGGECLVCHEDRTFCSSCHRTMIPIPHPIGDPTFVNEEGGRHTEEAEAFMEVCISCHDIGTSDPTCARCH